jgi:hypothetical protein
MFWDIGAGILLALGVSAYFGHEASWMFVLLGIIFALFPDIDIFLTRMPGGKYISSVIGEHRSALHNPALYIPITAIVWLVCGPEIAVLFAGGILSHLIHDTLFLGWGIKWLWPFSQKKLSFFHDRGGKITKDILVWEPHEEAEIVRTYQSPHWVRDFYFKPSIISLTEYLLFFCALLLLYRHFLG